MRATLDDTTRRSRAWYHEPWAIACLHLAAPPIGYYLLLRSPAIGRRRRIGFACAIALAALSVGAAEYATHPIDRGLSQLDLMILETRAGRLDEAGRHAEAAVAWRAVLARAPGRPYAAVRAGDALAQAGELRAAGTMYMAAGRRGRISDSGPAALGLARLLLESLERPREAASLAERLVETSQINDDTPDGLLLLAAIELGKGELGAAEHHARQIIEQFRRPLFGRAYRLLGRIRRAAGDLAGEVRMLAESVHNAPREREGHEGLALAVDRFTGNQVPFRAFAHACALDEMGRAHAQARAIASRILERHPHFLVGDIVHYVIATCLFWHEEDAKAAREHYKAVIQGHPRSECWYRAHFMMGRCHEILGEEWQAARYYRRLLEQKPGSHLGNQARLRLIRIRELGKLPRGFDLPLLGNEGRS